MLSVPNILGDEWENQSIGENPSVARRENPTDINLDEGFIATK